MSGCRRVVPLLEPFADGELTADHVIEVEQHLAECDSCVERVRLDAAIKRSTRRAVRAEAEPSVEFQARLSAALDTARPRPFADASVEHGRSLGWRQIVPMAAAATLTLVWGSSTFSPGDRLAALSGNPNEASLSNSVSLRNVDLLVDQLVNDHANGGVTEPQVTEPALVNRFEPEVGVPVRLPSLQQYYGARWEGGSVVPMRENRAASFRYRLAGHRVTLYVYDSRRLPLRATLEARVVRNVPVYFGNRRGYSVAAVEQRGVGCAVASDLPDQEGAELALASLY